MIPENHFSGDYQAARAKFLSACDAAGVVVASYQNPHVGPDGAPLFTDVCTIGASEAGAALTLCSGTHGVEGFAGSGIQTGLLRDGLASWLPSGVRVVMIHALNPYGFAYLRRANEDNVDVNRNFVDHSERYPPNDEYDRLSKVMAPVRLSLLSRVAAFYQIASFRLLRGSSPLQAAVSRGQYTHDQGLFFGGTAPIWSNSTFRAIAERYLGTADRVAFIDLHTGLGPHGYGEMIVGDPVNSDAFRRALRWWGARVRTVKDDSSVSVDLSGSIKSALSEMLQNTEFTCGSLEFGTVAPMRVLRALQAENWLHHHGGADHRQAEAVKTRLLRAFYPDTKEWRVQVWSQAVDVINQALLGLSRPGIAAGRPR
jgi:hypothetical protein